MAATIMEFIVQPANLGGNHPNDTLYQAQAAWRSAILAVMEQQADALVAGYRDATLRDPEAEHPLNNEYVKGLRAELNAPTASTQLDRDIAYSGQQIDQARVQIADLRFRIDSRLYDDTEVEAMRLRVDGLYQEIDEMHEIRVEDRATRRAQQEAEYAQRGVDFRAILANEAGSMVMDRLSDPLAFYGVEEVPEERHEEDQREDPSADVPPAAEITDPGDTGAKEMQDTKSRRPELAKLERLGYEGDEDAIREALGPFFQDNDISQEGRGDEVRERPAAGIATDRDVETAATGTRTGHLRRPVQVVPQPERGDGAPNADLVLAPDKSDELRVEDPEQSNDEVDSEPDESRDEFEEETGLENTDDPEYIISLDSYMDRVRGYRKAYGPNTHESEVLIQAQGQFERDRTPGFIARFKNFVDNLGRDSKHKKALQLRAEPYWYKQYLKVMTETEARAAARQRQSGGGSASGAGGSDARRRPAVSPRASTLKARLSEALQIIYVDNNDLGVTDEFRYGFRGERRKNWAFGQTQESPAWRLGNRIHAALIYLEPRKDQSAGSGDDSDPSHAPASAARARGGGGPRTSRSKRAGVRRRAAAPGEVRGRDILPGMDDEL